MNEVFFKNLKNLLREIFNQKENYYKSKYSASNITKKNIDEIKDKKTFTRIPPTTLKELAAIPFKKRKLRERSGFNKLVYCKPADTYLLFHRTLKEMPRNALQEDNFSKPLVLMGNVYDAIEGCLYFYNHNVLPLIGESLNPVVVYAMAKQYLIDSLYIDHVSIENFREQLLELKLPLQVVTIVDKQITTSDLKWPKNIKINCIISLPEFGYVAYACRKSLGKKQLVFHPYSDVFIEPARHSIITNARLFACPMIRYKSDLAIMEISSTCGCNLPSYSMI